VSPFDRREAALAAQDHPHYRQDRAEAVAVGIARMQTGAWQLEHLLASVYDAGYLTGHQDGTAPLQVETDVCLTEIEAFLLAQGDGGASV
jgi:hypothetical protein